MPQHADWVPGLERGTHWRRAFAPTDDHGLGLTCAAVGMGTERLPVVGPRTPQRHVALVVAAGSGWFSWDGRAPVVVTAPTLLWLLPGVEHLYGRSMPGWSECFVEFAGPAVHEFTQSGFADFLRTVVPLTSAEPARRVVRKLATVCNESEPSFGVSAVAGLHEFLATMRRSTAGLSRLRPSVLDELAEHAHLPIPVAEHAERLSLSQHELREEVRRTAGCNPKDFLLGVRLNLAKDLLATTDLKIAAIARRVGYDDQGYFSRLFTARIGISPGSFRDQHAQRG